MARSWAWLGVATVLVLARVAHGDLHAPPTVELVVVGGGAEAGRLIVTVSDALEARGVVTEAFAIARAGEASSVPRGSAVARVEVDLRSPEAVILVVEGRRVGPARRLLHRAPSVVLFREELAQAVESAVESQLFVDPETYALVAPPEPEPVTSSAPPPAAPTAASSTPSPTPALPPDAPPSTSRPSELRPVAVPDRVPAIPWPFSLDLATLGGTGGFGSGAGPSVLFGGEVSAAWQSRLRPAVAACARTLLPFESSADQVTARASALSLRALFGMSVLRSDWLEVVTRLGGGADVLWVTPSSASLGSSLLAGSSSETHAVATGSVVARVPVVSNVALTLQVDADVDLMPSRYVVDRGGMHDAALVPWPVRPIALAGFTFTTFGASSFVSRVVR